MFQKVDASNFHNWQERTSIKSYKEILHPIRRLCQTEWILGQNRPKTPPLVGGLSHVQQISTTMGLRNLLLVRRLCHMQQTLTRMDLRHLPLVRGHCLMQWTWTIPVGLNDLPLVIKLSLKQRTLTTSGSQGSAPCKRLYLAGWILTKMSSNDMNSPQQQLMFLIKDAGWESYELRVEQLASVAKQVVGCT